ncbi:MAG: Unknown protein [uncultured Sulfurovum sp.]|uniref:Outer membrane protein beta-barrel domain-containing protein n=1 Tax=uncultured Sulfurovum sp. TaxID=269237 RepID=A0A6S6SDN5_9BACT|nr:MAG: Unknown protein [uncultured Sulfurovum sp.]
MKKIILGLILTISLSMANSFAQLGLGYSQGENEGNYATGFAGLNVFGNIGLRLEYTKNVDNHAEFSKEDISRYGVFATYTLPLSSSFSITPKAGLTKTDGEFTFKGVADEVSDSSTEFTYGLEINYHYNENVGLFIGYTDYGNELDLKNIDKDKMDTQNYMFGIKVDL